MSVCKCLMLSHRNVWHVWVFRLYTIQRRHTLGECYLHPKCRDLGLSGQLIEQQGRTYLAAIRLSCDLVSTLRLLFSYRPLLWGLILSLHSVLNLTQSSYLSRRMEGDRMCCVVKASVCPCSIWGVCGKGCIWGICAHSASVLLLDYEKLFWV